MTDPIDRYAEKFPYELAAGIEGLDNRKKRAVFVLLFDNPGLAFTEIQEKLGGPEEVGQQTLTDCLEELQKGGLIDKRLRGPGDETRFTTAYDVTQFGENFFRFILYSMGERGIGYESSELKDIGNPGREIRQKRRLLES